jgi:hypothetical protein
MIELDSGRIHVRRAKNGVDSTHPLTGKEIRALRQLRRENLQSRFVFNTERGGPVTRAWFLKMIRRTGELAKLPFPAHPHMLRHGCGFKLANDGVGEHNRAESNLVVYRPAARIVCAASRPLASALHRLAGTCVGYAGANPNSINAEHCRRPSSASHSARRLRKSVSSAAAIRRLFQLYGFEFRG